MSKLTRKEFESQLTEIDRFKRINSDEVTDFINSINDLLKFHDTIMNVFSGDEELFKEDKDGES